MAKLSAHGTELARRETPTVRIAVMSDGQIMRNYGQGWKLWRRVKAGVDITAYAAKFDQHTIEIMPELQRYVATLIDACDLEHRARLHTTISLMPSDPDGVWSELNDYSGYTLDLNDICRACRAYEAVESAIKAETVSTEVR